MKKRTIFLVLIAALLIPLSGCSQEGRYLSLSKGDRIRFNRIYRQLETETSHEKRFIAMRQMLEFLSSRVSRGEINLFLTTYVQKNQNDPFNAYYLMLVARNHREDMAYPFAIKYYERILRNYHDLRHMGNSIHFLALRDLLNIVENDEARILYYRDKLTRFSGDINIKEIYYHLGNAYGRVGNWAQAVRAYRRFLDFYDTANSDGFMDRERVVNFLAFYHADKDWTFESLDELVEVVVSSINRAKFRGDSRIFRQYMSRVNFFAVSWEDGESGTPPEFIPNLNTFLSPRINVSRVLEDISNQREAFLRTTGWTYRISTWYLYFRRINFPADSSIHGNWEWAGIYFGERPFAVSHGR